MTLALATRGYVCVGGVQPGVLAYLHPETASVRQGAQLSMAVVLTSQAPVDTVVALSSDDPSVVSVPASVTVLQGQVVATFLATAGDLGNAQITASLDTIAKHSDLEVVYVDAALRPKVTGTVTLKPKGVSAQNLRPGVVDAENQDPPELRPQVTEAKNLKPRGTSARNLKPKVYDTEE
jgi:hypothetical protein